MLGFLREYIDGCMSVPLDMQQDVKHAEDPFMLHFFDEYLDSK